MMSNKIRRVKRYIQFIIECIAEKIMGLDFTMRDTNLLVKSNQVYHGYSKTPEKHVKEAFDLLPIDFSRNNFIDIGCGKGIVLKIAEKYGFNKITGIDMDERMIQIAQKNMKRLNIERVECIYGNALEFKEWKDYHVFFLFNPFSPEIFKQVFEKIKQSMVDHPRTIYLVYHDPACRNLVEAAGFKKINKLYDHLRNNETAIYQYTAGNYKSGTPRM